MTEAVEQASARLRSGKSAAAFRTISEVATELEVPQHVLRFWETKFSQVRPLKRAGGRRYYRPEDVELLRRIRDLLYANGYTIKGVQKLLREGGAKALSDPGPMVPGAPSGAPSGTGTDDGTVDPTPARSSGAAPDAADAEASPPDIAATVAAAEGVAATAGGPAPGPGLDPDTRQALQALLEELRAARALLSVR